MVWLSELEPLENEDRWDVGPVTMGTKKYERSLTGPSCTFTNYDISYNLFRRYQRFKATIGFSDLAATDSAASFTVIADGRQIYRSETLIPGDLESVDIPVRGVYRLSLRASAGCESSGGTWGGARLEP